VELAPRSLSRVFFCNSGTESVEAALKLGRLSTGRGAVVSFKRSFHGRTFGAMSASFQPKHHQMFAPVLEGVRFAPYNAVDPLERDLTGDVGCVLLELVQGEGGVHPADPRFVKTVARLCAERGILLVVDEVQTGFGRTGRLFACEHHDLRPDLLCVAKSMAGGLPMGGVLIGEALGEIPRKVHGSTMGGNPLACAGALATLDVLQEQDLVGRAARLGRHALERFSAIASPVVREARGLGLFLGLELRIKSAPVVRRLQDEGILVLQAGPTVIRMLPPLVIEEADLEHVLTAVEAAVAGDGTAASAP
jgi:acetylornithine/succinyldiaminopimelate/putrescine aminotransferase